MDGPLDGGEAVRRPAEPWYLAAALLAFVALVLPLGGAISFADHPSLLVATISAAALFTAAACRFSAPLASAGAILTCAVTVQLLGVPGVAGNAGPGFWSLVLAGWLAASLVVTGLASVRPQNPVVRHLLDLAIPVLFGSFMFYLWEVAVRGFGVPAVLMPSPSATAARFSGSLATLAEDFVQTFVRGMLTGYVIGCSAGFAVAIIAYRFTFLGRGLLPIGNFISALPIVGIAPIMVMWFGFDWPSKAAVVAIITFFPMLVNTLAGLSAAGHIERDLMRSYGATPAQTLTKLNLPAAMPFIFNALKINSTLALIGAIVAEFFGTPTRGIGFRISIEVARMSLDMVWAEIALAAIAGMAFYGFVALAERAMTFWHPSYRT
jgi:NitT/TauT family transport system permease protein